MSDYPHAFHVGGETVYGVSALLDLAKRLMAERDELLDRLTAIEHRMPEELSRLERDRDEARQNTFGPPSGDPRTAGGGMCHAESDTTFTGVESVNATASGYIRCATCDKYYPNPRCPNCRAD